MALPFGRGNGQTSDPKASHARRRSTLRETAKPTLLGPRPLESGKRYVFWQFVRREIDPDTYI